jgi:hypothetical protein
VRWWAATHGLDQGKHSGVTQGVFFDSGQIKELGNAVVVRANQLGVGFFINWNIRDFLKAVLGKEFGFEG